MKQFLMGALVALSVGIAAVPATAAPQFEAPIQPALFQADGSTASIQTVQYRPYGYRAPRRFARPHRRLYRPPHRGYGGPRGFYRGPVVRPGYRRY